MELRPGPGGNEAEVSARLRQMLLDVTTTEKQIQGEIDRLTAQRSRLVEQSASMPADNADLKRRVDESIAQTDTRLLDLRLQLDSVAQSRAEIAAQVQGFSQTAVTAEAEATIAELRRVFAMSDLDEPAAGADQSGQPGPDLRAELAKATVDAELAALRRELGLPDPAPPPPPPAVEGQGPAAAGTVPPTSESGSPTDATSPPTNVASPPGNATSPPTNAASPPTGATGSPADGSATSPATGTAPSAPEQAPAGTQPPAGRTILPATSTAPVTGPAADPPNVPQPGTVLDPPPEEPTLPGLPEPKEPPTQPRK